MSETNLPQVIEMNNQRLLTSKQLAEFYGTDVLHIQQNFKNNRDRYLPGKHFILLEGEDLKRFKNLLENLPLVDKRAPSLYLWTEKGARQHAKSLNTDQAWTSYERLVDEYYQLLDVVQNIPIETHTLTKLLAKRAEVNVSRIPDHFYAVMGVLFNHLYNLELLTGDLDAHATIEVSVGKCWKRQADEVLHIPASDTVKYKHILPNGMVVDALAYSHKWLTNFEKWLWLDYFPNNFPKYVEERKKRIGQMQLSAPKKQGRLN